MGNIFQSITSVYLYNIFSEIFPKAITCFLVYTLSRLWMESVWKGFHTDFERSWFGSNHFSKDKLFFFSWTKLFRVQTL